MVRQHFGSAAKKLKEAARHWASGGSGPAAPVEDDELAAWGITRADLPDEEPDQETRFEVFPENWATVMMFIRLFSQWRAGPMGGFLGLEYSGVETLLRIERVKNRAEMFAHLQIM